eukprot:174775_1
MHQSDKKNKNSINLAKLIKSKWNGISKKSGKSVHSPEDFIKQYAQTNTNKLTDIKSLDLRRKIFVSLLGVFQTWRKMPIVTLYSCIFILPLKKDFIYNPSKYDEEIKTHIIGQMNIFSDASEIKQFIEMLKWKDHQGLVLWMLDEHIHDNNDYYNLINPFWCHLNAKLTNLYDPITCSNYNNINLNMKWWQNKDKYISKYNIKASSILSEFYFLTMKFKCIQEILYQSNPKSFDVVQCYNEYNDCTQTDDFKLYVLDENNTDLVLATTKSDLEIRHINAENNEDNWWISDCYDPYELD